MARFHLGLETVFLGLQFLPESQSSWVILVHLLYLILLSYNRGHFFLRPVHVALETLVFELL